MVIILSKIPEPNGHKIIMNSTMGHLVMCSPGNVCKGPFTLGGISRGAISRWNRCVYTRRETGGKAVGVMQMSNRLFT